MSAQVRTCWMCGNPADSREHKFKKSDLAKSSKTWAPKDQPFLVTNRGVQRIQGPGSKLVTFDRVLCQACNTTRSQPYDLAYERFSDWVNQRGVALMSETSLDFAAIYGSEHQVEVLNLLRYFAKHLGCRLASENYAVPPGFAQSMATCDLSPFAVSLSRNLQLNSFAVRGPGVLHNFPTLGFYSPSTCEVHGPYLSGMIVGHLDVVYRYNYARRYSWEGDPIVPTEQIARLGKYIAGSPHPTDGQIPGSEISRQFTIGGVEFNIPLLTREHVQSVLSLGLPTADMSAEENLDARLKIVHAILAPFYPEVTMDFLEDNLTIPDSDALWKCVLASPP